MKVLQIHDLSRNLHLRLFTRKLSDNINFYPAGLLACFLLIAFPSHPGCAGSKKVACGINSSAYNAIETHSYGDSAGFSPDFPFNPAIRGPDQQM